jgi:excisionase family DNA binding protein
MDDRPFWDAQGLLGAREVAARLNVSRDRVYELARQRLIPCVRLGRQVRFDAAALEHWIDTGGQQLDALGERHERLPATRSRASTALRHVSPNLRKRADDSGSRVAPPRLRGDDAGP